LTAGQVGEFFRWIFKGTEREIIDNLTDRGCACVDPGRMKANDPANIPMMKILEFALTEDHDEKVRRVRKMLVFFRPVPRMTLKRFDVFARAMICNIDPNMIDSLFRSTLIQNSFRVDMDEGAFVEHFRHLERPVVPHGWQKAVISPDEFAELSPIYAVVLNRRKQFSPFVTDMLKNVDASQSEDLNAMVGEIRHQLFQMLEAIVSCDGPYFYQTYHRLLQTVMLTSLTLNLPHTSAIIRQGSDFHAVLMKKFQTLLAMHEVQGVHSSNR
jgi:hypothetical protein